MIKSFNLAIALLFCLSVQAQTPQKFNYQGVARNNTGTVISNQNISIRASIVDGSLNGPDLYVETHAATTSSLGLFTLGIGAGSSSLGNFSDIVWSSGDKFLKIEIDPLGGNDYVLAGTTQLLSVPFALQSQNTEKIQGRAIASTLPAEGQALTWDATAAIWRPKTPGLQSAGWMLTGNAGTNPASNFVGTTDDQPLIFKVNNVLAGKITAAGDGNTYLGLQAGKNATGDKNTAIGFESLLLNTTGSKNTAYGSHTLYYNDSGHYNTAIGRNAQYSNTTGSSNTALGMSALFCNISHSNLVAVGDSALYNNGLGTSDPVKAAENTAVGSKALYANLHGSRNTATGFQALYTNVFGKDNTANGDLALFFTKNSGNTAFGASAGANTDNSSNCTYLGFFADNDNFQGVYSNSTALGASSRITASNQVRIGNASIQSIGGFQNWSNLSDGRFKKDVQENVPGLDFIQKLRPVTYHLDAKGLAKYLKEDAKNARDTKAQDEEISEACRLAREEKSAYLETGFIAQEVEAAAKTLGYSFSGVDAPKHENDLYSLRYAEFVVPLVKAVQEQQAMIQQLQQENATLRMQTGKIEQLDKEFQQIKALLREKSN